MLLLLLTAAPPSYIAPEASAATSPTIFGSVVIQEGKHLGRVIPMFIYQNGEYHTARVFGTGPITTDRKLISRSILNRIRHFALYKGGRYLGVIRVSKLAVERVCGESGPHEVFGVGEIRWASSPTDINEETTLDAVSPTFTQQFFAKRQALSESERSLLISTAKTQISGALLRLRQVSLPADGEQPLTHFSGRVTPQADLIPGDIALIDRPPSRTHLIIASVKVPLTAPPHVYLRMLLAVNSIGHHPSVLLNLPAFDWATNDHKSIDSPLYTFRTTMDLTGDGRGQLIVQKTYYVSSEVVVLDQRGSNFIPVFQVVDGEHPGC